MTSTVDDAAEEVGLRERKKNQTRIAIHEAALRLIEAQGLEATTIEQICQEADVSSRTFFNYYPSKAAATLELPGTTIDPVTVAAFRAAEGTLVSAVCAAIGSSAELGLNHVTMKRLIVRRPELLPTISRMMIDVRSQFISLAAERATSPVQAELAVSLVMAALTRVMHDENSSDEPLTDRLRETVDLLIGVSREQLEPVRLAE